MFGEEPPREQSCSHQDVLEMAGNRMPNGCVGKAGGMAAKAGQPYRPPLQSFVRNAIEKRSTG